MFGYHFTSDTLRNGEPLPPIGEWLEHSGPIIPCASGLHMSEHPFDALIYAPGCLLHYVELEGDLQSHSKDKWLGRRRKIIKTVDATELLQSFARWCALQVIDLWDAPDSVKRYLETGDESAGYAIAAGYAGYAIAAGCAAIDAGYAAIDAGYAARVAGYAARVAARDAEYTGYAVRSAQRAKFAEMLAEMVADNFISKGD